MTIVVHCATIGRMPDADLLTSREAADLVGCSVTTISRAVADGTLTPIRRIAAGRYGSFLFVRGDVEEFAKTWGKAS